MHMLGACLIGLFWQQVAFVGHDIGHNSITHNRNTAPYPARRPSETASSFNGLTGNDGSFQGRRTTCSGQ